MIGRLVALGLVGAAVGGSAWAQSGGLPDPEPDLQALKSGPQVTPDTAVPMPEIAWSRSQARELVAALKGVAADGLDPKDYDVAAVEAALAGGAGPALNTAATRAAMQLARDHLFGAVDDKRQFFWYIERNGAEGAALAGGLTEAVAGGRVGDWLQSLLPQNRHYRAMKRELGATKDAALRTRLLANMERWRWMPRQLGSNYVYVNVPTYQLWLVENNSIIWDTPVIVGAKRTPTPQLHVPATDVVANPSWYIPQSIIKEEGIRPGNKKYEVKVAADGTVTARQKPGPNNSLGRIKIDMKNPYAIYLHDTPAKSLFAKQERALSHGCIRVAWVGQLAARLLGQEDVPTLDSALANPSQTKVIPLKRQWPVWLVYFTADEDANGKLRTLGDPYGRDAAVAKALADA